MQIRIAMPDGSTAERSLDGGSFLIGRSSKADLVVLDRSMSREHARLVRDGAQWTVEDLGSRNGTFLNGKNVTAPTVLSPGDTLIVGGATITIGGAPAASTVPVARPSPLGFGERSVLRPAAELLQLEESGPRPAEIREEAQLRRYAERLRIVNEVHQALAHSIALEELLELILDRAFDHLKPEEGAIFLKRGREYYCAASRSSRSGRGGTLFSRHLVEEVAEKGLAALVVDTQIDERFNQAMSIMGAGVRSLVAAPLSDGGRPLGMIVLGSLYAVRQFTEEDMELLVSLASVAALRIANVALAEEAAERRRLDQEVTLARRIQEALLPDALPEVPGFEVFGSNFPSQGVSGDYYQVRPRLDGAEVALQVIDVSGKGIGASLLTASVEALCVAPLEDGLPPDEIYGRVSRLLYQRTPPEKYATGFLAVLEPASGAVRFCNAGHLPGLVLHGDGAAEWLGNGGPPLGLLPGASYVRGEACLGPGDLLVIYSDGITEAVDPDDEMYGRERLADVCAQHQNEPLGDLAAAIDRDLADFVKGVPFHDDRTVVLLRRVRR
jgi:serine phosphatase RsbU (regulator of sigma subunit)